MFTCCFDNMKQFIFSILVLSALISCNPDKNKRPDPTKLRFTTTDDDELFFRNLRQVYYDKEDMTAAKLQVFRYSDRLIRPEKPQVQLAMVVNWRFDEAYLLIEPNDKINTDKPIEINWKNNETGKSGKYIFNYGSKEDHLKFAGQLYGSVLDGHTLEYVTDSAAVPLLDLPEEREAFRISMFDYYALTGNVR